MKESFEIAKTELMELMNDGTHCSESIDYIKKSNTFEDMLMCLMAYRLETSVRSFPPIDWCRKWFSDDLQAINDIGIYLDQQIELVNPSTNLFFFGECRVKIISDVLKLIFVTARDGSEIEIEARDNSMMYITVRDRSNVRVEKSNFSSIKIVRR